MPNMDHSNLMYNQNGIRIGSVCLESSPCQHDVSLDGHPYEHLDACTIAILFRILKITCPEHFLYAQQHPFYKLNYHNVLAKYQWFILLKTYLF